MDLPIFAPIAAAVIVAAFIQGATGVGFALIVAPVLAFLAPDLVPVCVRRTVGVAAKRVAVPKRKRLAGRKAVEWLIASAKLDA